MITGSNCGCLVCRLEKSLIAELGDESSTRQYRLLTAPSLILSRFENPLDLIDHLHAPDSIRDGSSGDSTLVELLGLCVKPNAESAWQRILPLVFIPTIHRTTSQVAATFPSLERDDISQRVIVALLEFLPSRELQVRRSHIAFTIARKLRRITFRWAIRESRGPASEESDRDRAVQTDGTLAAEPLHHRLLLYQFLDNCRRAGWLSREECDLLIQSKVEGVSCPELARRNGHSSVATQHRIQRVINRLRRLARKTLSDSARQLELFAR